MSWRTEDLAHIQRLVEYKHHAHEHRSQDRLLTAVPQARALLERLADRGGNLGSAVAALCRLLEHYGATEVQVGVATALAQDLPHAGAVRQTLERRRRERGLPPPVAVVLPDKPELRDLHVQPHALANYEHLTPKEPEDA